ncbi:hypothetical protein B0H10DRAFT_2241392 [Mycena sp. CBHHK59/15]|nr:hypothetical protein B0H10DRAFT_2241392 [Mycena sp. CBHHK59/15]
MAPKYRWGDPEGLRTARTISDAYSTAKLSCAKWPGTVTSTQIFPLVRYHKELSTKGLAANIVLELGKLGIPAFAYCHETVTAARKAGRNLVHEIRECKSWNVICVDPEHLRDKAWREITAFASDPDYAYGARPTSDYV